MAIRIIVTHKDRKQLEPSWVQRFISTFVPDPESPRGTLYVTRRDTDIDVVEVEGDVDRAVFIAYADVQVHDVKMPKLYYARIVTELADDAWQIDAYDFEHGRIVVNNKVINATSVKHVDGRIFLTFEVE